MAPMNRQFQASGAISPLSPVYPFNEPGQVIVLHDGPVLRLAPHDPPGVVELSCVPDLSVVWRIEDSSAWIHRSIATSMESPQASGPSEAGWRFTK
jgi:hypothetical protein